MIQGGCSQKLLRIDPTHQTDAEELIPELTVFATPVASSSYPMALSMETPIKLHALCGAPR